MYHWPFWVGFLVPFLLLYIFDWIMFIVILVSVIKNRRAINKGRREMRDRLVIALSLAVVFGLGWGFGLLATTYPSEGATITFQVIFSLLVASQGILLFVLHGL